MRTNLFEMLQICYFPTFHLRVAKSLNLRCMFLAGASPRTPQGPHNLSLLSSVATSPAEPPEAPPNNAKKRALFNDHGHRGSTWSAPGPQLLRPLATEGPFPPPQPQAPPVIPLGLTSPQTTIGLCFDYSQCTLRAL